MAELESLLEALRQDVTGALADSIMAAWLEGAQATAGAVSSEVALPSGASGLPPTLPPTPSAGAPDAGEPEFPGLDRAVRSLLDRRLVSPQEFSELTTAARRQAFTITADLTEDTIEQIRDMLAENLEGPASREAFMDAVREEVDTLPISDAHLEQVYRNAANQAYTQGQDHVLDHPLVADAFPYRAYFVIRDGRARDEHRQMEKLGLNGTNVFHKLDPTWLRFKPPWDWNCRCGWAPLSIRDAARLGVAEAQEWLETGAEPVHLPVKPPLFAPSPSWDIQQISA